MRKSLAQILVDRKLFTKQQVDDFIKFSLEANLNLDEYLRTNNLLKDDQIAKIYAEQFNIKFVENITEKMADPELLARIPLKFLREHIVIPVWYQDHATIVTANPSDFQPIDELTLLLGDDTHRLFQPGNLLLMLLIAIILLKAPSR